ncbi:hypothetical protein OGAPHI_001762 [Ogataea philodendri]|uniref:Deoxycytidylate deaminase n=1 Tax=Ogataea philodendri TaxID=1378263 RepID=A0A9P8P9E2_9ASCO|nr:uncharacterized protein OGAPHI_001762 [Ogataea philodendri]KAH3668008.1 hypothetical protein OGAPHI_001762 [Ogataea philodendri]
MLIGITGTIFSGKSELASFLVQEHQFKYITLAACKREADPDTFKCFVTEQELIDFVTKNWIDNFVMTCVDNYEFLQGLLKRPFFLLLATDASLMTRFNRLKADKRHTEYSKELTFEEFVLKSDEYNFRQEGELLKIMDKSEIRIINDTDTIKGFHDKLRSLDLLNGERLRPSWDAYFMKLADLAAFRSNCMKRRVGCVVVRENRIIATGYNGTPRNFKNCNHGGCPRCNSGNSSGVGLSTCLCLHAEENAILEAGRDRIGNNAVLYCNTCPCLTCSIKIVQSGIKEVVYSQSYSMDVLSSNVFKEAGIKLRQYVLPLNGVVIA